MEPLGCPPGGDGGESWGGGGDPDRHALAPERRTQNPQTRQVSMSQEPPGRWEGRRCQSGGWAQSWEAT